ncbi:MAG: hypothetical protein HDR30_07800 [Lachnospiraceae bacterium]|nr:hypothetical protein [Lachnospiraceae bacterium]
MKKKFLALFLTAALAVSVTACGSDDSKSTSAPADTTATADAGQSESEKKEEAAKDAEEEKKEEAEEAKAEVENPIEESLKRMAEVDSMEMKMVMNMDMSVEADGQKESVESVTTMDMECMTNPLKIKMEMEVDMGAAGSQSMSIYGDVDESGNYVMYMFDGESWLAMQVSEFDLNAYNAQSSMEAQIGDTSVYILEGTDKLNGADVYKYSYTMTGDEMKEALQEAGALDSLSDLGLSTSDAYGMLDGLGEIVTYVYVDAETYYPVQYEMDMTDVMDALYAAIIEAMGEQAEGLSMSVSKMELVMTCSNFNGISDITVPEEALSAAVVQ